MPVVVDQVPDMPVTLTWEPLGMPATAEVQVVAAVERPNQVCALEEGE